MDASVHLSPLIFLFLPQILAGFEATHDSKHGGVFVCLFVFTFDYAITVVPSPTSFPSTLHPLSHSISPFSSCPGDIHICSLASTFPILFLTSPCLYCSYHLCFLITVPFPPFSPFPLPADNPPHDFHLYNCIPVLVVCLVCFWFFRFGFC